MKYTLRTLFLFTALVGYTLGVEKMWESEAIGLCAECHWLGFMDYTWRDIYIYPDTYVDEQMCESCYSKLPEPEIRFLSPDGKTWVPGISVDR